MVQFALRARSSESRESVELTHRLSSKGSCIGLPQHSYRSFAARTARRNVSNPNLELSGHVLETARLSQNAGRCDEQAT